MAIREWRLALPSIKVNDKEYEIKRKLSFGEVKRFQNSLDNIIGMDKRIASATPEELEVIASQGMKSTTEQMDMIEQTLKSCLGFTQETLNTISFNDAVVLFNEVFSSSTVVKKKSDQPYV